LGWLLAINKAKSPAHSGTICVGVAFGGIIQKMGFGKKEEGV
jgi:hypothetical protein